MKTAVVIGGNGYIGTAICEKLRKVDYHVEPFIGNAILADSYKCLPDKIDAAIYLPGTNHIKPIHELSEEYWDDIMNVNLRGCYQFAKFAFAKLTPGSSFITISSILTQHPYPNRIAYAAAKSALETLIRGLAVEWNGHAYTHCIRLGHLKGFSPTWPKNPVVLEAVRQNTPGEELIDREDVANYISWLVQGGCKAVNGGVIDMDAGYCINRWPID